MPPPEPPAAPAPGLVPVRLVEHGGQLAVEWIELRALGAEGPFWERRVAAARAAGHAGTVRPLDSLIETPVRRAPDGIVLHLGRSGSTLVTRMLGAHRECGVVGESELINTLLVLPGLDLARRAELIAAAAGALAHGARFVLKLSSWNAVHLDVLRCAFAATPMVFLHRHPLEVLVSIRDRPPDWLGARRHPEIAAARSRIAAATIAGMEPQVYAARLAASILETVAGALETGERRLELVAYEQLPAALGQRIAPAFGWHGSEADRDAWAKIAAVDAKDPQARRAFRADGAAKRRAAGAGIEALVESTMMPAYRRLLAAAP